MPRSDAANQGIRDARRQRIIEVAAGVFAHQGLAGTKISHLAAAAEMSQGLLYRYFASKEEVFTAVVEMVDEASTLLVKQVSSQPNTAGEKLRWLTEQLLHIQYAMPAFALVVAHALTNVTVPVEVRAIALHETETLRLAFSNIIREGQQSGEVISGNPDQLAMLYLTTLHSLALGSPFFQRAEIGYPDTTTVMSFLTARRPSHADH